MTPILITLWLVCGLFAAYHAHLGLQHDCREEGISGDTPLGGMWIAWGPFLVVLIALGLLSLIVVCIIERTEHIPVDADGTCEEDWQCLDHP